MKFRHVLLLYLICIGLLVACQSATSPVEKEDVALQEDTAVISTTIPPTSQPATSPPQTATPYPTPSLIEDEFMISYYQMSMEDGTNLEYGLVLPNNYQAGKSYPILLALPPGPQTKSMVRVGIDGYWGVEAQKRGWIVVSPIAPNGNLFFQESGQYIPEFLARIEQLYAPQGEKFYISGISNGGISAFHIAIAQPEKFRKMLILPGFPQADYFAQLEKVTDIPIFMFVGEQDTDWVKRMEATEAELNQLGGTVVLEIVPNEGHVIQSLDGKRLFDILESE